VHVERATETDTQTISEILGEVEAYYGGKDTPADQTQIRTVLFGTGPVATVLLAREGDERPRDWPPSRCLWPAAGADPRCT